MYNINIIIVEDEPAILQGIVMLIKRIDLPLVITGTYSNGKEALIDLEHSCPDIVMTDVQMPVMSGLQLVEELKSMNYPAEFVILSGYAEFEYAQTAMSLGVHHYLLKSPRIRELKEALASICDSILKMRYHKYQVYFQELLYQQFPLHENVSPVHDASIRILLYTLGPLLDKLPEESVFYQNHISKTKTLQLITEHFPQSKGQIWILNGYSPNTKIILEANFNGYSPSPEELFELLKSQTKNNRIWVTLVVLPETENMNELRDIFLSGTKQLQKAVQFGKNQLLSVSENSSVFVTDTLRRTERDMLFKVLNTQQTKLIVEQYRYFAKSWAEQNYSQTECTALTRRFLTEICRTLPGSETTVLEETALNELFRITANSCSYEEFFNNCCQLIETILGNLCSFSGDSQIKDSVEALYSHILSSFTKEIDINAFAREHGYHPVYLITQFTKLKGISPTKLIIQLRIERAKKFLLSTDMSLKDIADSIGYYDVSYFSRLFKEREGMSPGNYRKEKHL